MSDHEFEKQVRQKLNDLRFTPSAGSWENIEKGLQEGRKHRAPVYWLLFLLLGLGAGGYFWYQDQGNNSGTHLVKREKGEGNRDKGEEKTVSLIGKREKGEGNREKGEEKTVSLIGKREKGEGKKESLIKKSELPVLNHDLKTGDREPSFADGDLSSGVPENENGFLQKQIPGVDSRLSVAPPVAAFNPLPHKPASLNNLHASPAPPLLMQPKKWSFGISLFAGISTMNEGSLFNFSKAKVVDVARNAPNLAFAPSYTPSTITPGLSYAAGFVVRRSLSKRFSLTGGINYLQLNTKHNVGNQLYGTQAVNSGTNGYRYVNNAFALALGTPEDYKNRYHFVEIPVNLNTRLNKSKKYPVYWNAGIAYSRMLSTNNLLFDGSTGVYYKDDKMLNRSQAAVTTGFNFVFFQKSDKPLWVGPSVRYNVSKLLNEDVPENKNFLSAGIDFKLFLK